MKKNILEYLLLIVVVFLLSIDLYAVSVDKENGRIRLFPVSQTVINLNKEDSFFVLVNYLEDGGGYDVPVLKGFCTDSEGRFYFMGGTSRTNVACYDGAEKIWQRKIDFSPKITTNAVFRIYSDSLKIFDENGMSLYSISKDGTGNVAKHKLTGTSCDTVIYAAPTQSGFSLIAAHKGRIKWNEFMSSCILIGKMYHYEVSYDGECKQKETLTNLDIDTLVNNYQERTATDTNIKLFVRFGDLIVGGPSNTKSCMLLLLDGKCSLYTNPCALRLGVVSSGNLMSFNGNFCYVCTYNQEKNILVVYKYDLSKWLSYLRLSSNIH